MNEDEILVSVVIACRNCEEYISKCIDSILTQTHKNLEVLVCDDASTDSSIDILLEYEKKDKRIRVLKNFNNLMAAASRNRCIEISKGKYIVIQDADDFSTPDRITILLNYLEKNPEVSFISSAAYLFSTSDIQADSVMVKKKKKPTKKDFLWGLPFIHGSTMFRRECIIRIGGYRVVKETKRGQDYDMFMRMYAEGYHGININEPLYWIRAGGNLIKKQILSSVKNEFKIRMYGFKRLGLMPLGYLFVFKPYGAFIFHNARYLINLFRKKYCLFILL